MKKVLEDTRWLICVSTFLTITFLAISGMAAKITPEEKLRKAETLSITASEMATQAQESYNVGLAQDALDLANQATYLVLEVVTETGEKADPALAQATIHTANSVIKAITQIIAAATFISQISEGPRTIANAKEILEKANKANELNNKAIQTVRSPIGEPGEKGVPEKKAPKKAAPKAELPDTETTEIEVYQHQKEVSPSQ